MVRKTRSIVVMLASIVLLLVMTRMFFLDIMIVEGTSMDPTLREGTLIFVNKLAYGIMEPVTNKYLVRRREPSRNEIIIFRSPLDDTTTVKRCRGIAGDTLQTVGGNLVIDNEKIPLKFYQEGIVGAIFRIPPGFIFVVGDNFEASLDSRTFGLLRAEQVTGRVLFVKDERKANNER